MSKPHKHIAIDDHINDLFLGLAGPGLVLTALVLLAFAYTGWNRTSRSHLNRVSFRLLVYAMISSIISHATLIANLFPAVTESNAGCTFVAFAGVATLMFSACMFFCMALNLQLVLIHGINGRMMEKYYLIGSSFLVAACNITPLAAGQFGYFDINDTCWFANPDPAVQLRWLISCESFWFLFIATGELVSFLILVGFMLQHQRRTAHVHSATATSFSSTQGSVAPIVQYRDIILRIGLYPLLSCCLNFSGCILDLYLVKNTEETELNWRLNIVDLCIYALRPFFYACLAATDPSFLRAVRSLRPATASLTELSSASSANHTASVHSMASRQKRFSTGTKALVHIDLERVADSGNLAEQRPSVETRGMSVDTRNEEATVGDLEQGIQTGAREAGLRFSEHACEKQVIRASHKEDGIECQI